MEILGNDDLSSIISWLPSGRSFVIYNKERFAREVLPAFFQKNTKYASFTRRMRRWKFRRMPQSTASRTKSYPVSMPVYHHPLFNKNNIGDCLQMRPKPQTNYKKVNLVALSEASPKVSSDEAAKIKSVPTGNHCCYGTNSSISNNLQQIEEVARSLPVDNFYLPSPKTRTVSMESLGTFQDDVSMKRHEEEVLEDRSTLPNHSWTVESQPALSAIDSHDGSLVHLLSSGSFQSSPEQQHESVHHRLLAVCPTYLQEYQRSLTEAHAQHQAFLERQIYLSQLAYNNLVAGLSIASVFP